MNFIKITTVTFLVSLSSFAFAMDKNYCSEGLPLCLEEISYISKQFLQLRKSNSKEYDADIRFWKNLLSICDGSTCTIDVNRRTFRNLIEVSNDSKEATSSIVLKLSNRLRDVKSFVRECVINKSHCNKKLPSYIELIHSVSEEVLIIVGRSHSKYTDSRISSYERVLSLCGAPRCRVTYNLSVVRNLIEITSDFKKALNEYDLYFSKTLKNIESFVRECVK